MSTSHRATYLSAIAALGVAFGLILSPAFGATVTITGQTTKGTAAQDLIVVLDPLEVMPPPSHDAAVIDQVNKRFDPKINVIRTGTSVTFPNSDHIRHQVYSFSAAKKFSLKLYAGTPAAPVLFDAPGLVVLGCNIHDNMAAFVAVVDSPYFAKLPDSGSVSITVPNGRYRVRVWHPSLGAQPGAQQIVVKDAPQTLNLAVNLDGGAVAPWPE